jgi:hypothetical protein
VLFQGQFDVRNQSPLSAFWLLFVWWT